MWASGVLFASPVGDVGPLGIYWGTLARGTTEDPMIQRLLDLYEMYLGLIRKPLSLLWGRSVY